MSIVRALSAEVLKITTTRIWWVLVIIMIVYVGSLAGGLGAFFGWLSLNPEMAAASGQSALPPGLPLAPLIYSFATSVGYVFPVLLGALAVTGEFRHQTLTPTFLAIPRREVVLGAKFMTLFVFGGVFGLVAFIGSVGFGSLALVAFGVDPMLGDSDTWALIGRGILAMALWGAIGVGLGALVPNQVAAIVIVIAFTQFVEPMLRLVASFNEVTGSIAQFLPGAASDALVGASFYTIAGMGAVQSLEWWQGGVVLLVLALIAAGIGYFTSWRRDVS